MVFISLLSLLVPGFLLSRLVSKKNERIIKNTLLVSLSLFPQFFLLLDKYSKTNINQKVIILVVLLTNLFAFILINRNRQKTNNKNLNYPLLLTIISASVFYYAYFIFKKISPTGDITNLFIHSSFFIKNGHLKHAFSDRSFVFLFPAIFQQLSGQTLEISYRIYSLLYFVLISQSIYLISKKLLKNKHLSFFITLPIIFSEAFFNNILTIVPFTLGIITLFSIVEILISNQKPTNIQILFIYYLWSNIFNIHGVIAFGSLLIIPVLFAFQQRKKLLTNKKVHFLGLIMFLLLSQSLILKRGNVLVREIKKSYNITFNAKSTSTQNNSNDNPDKALDTKKISYEWTRVRKPEKITQFPIYKESYITHFSLLLLILSLLGVFYSIQTKNKSLQIFLIFTVVLFLFTQQKLVGTDWFSFRFLYFLSPAIFIFSAYGLKTLIKNLKKMKINLPKAVIFILIPVLSIHPLKRSFDFALNYAPVISQPEYDLYSSFKETIPNDETVFIISLVNKWILGLDQETNYLLVDKGKMCPKDKDLNQKQLNKPEWRVSRAFSTNTDSIKDSVNIVKEYTGGKDYYVLLNTQHDNCINPDLFLRSHYEFLVEDEDNGIYFIKSK